MRPTRADSTYRLAFWLGAALAVLPAAPASAQIWKCENASGVVEYSNSPAASQGGRTCKQVDLGPITTIPAPKLPPQKAGAGGAAPAAAGGSSGAAPAGTAAARPASPEGFPKVETAAQKARDSDRKRILEDELKKEEAKLFELKKEYNSGEPERVGGERNYQKYLDRVERLKEDIARAEANIGAIRRELASIKE
jgi:hypothetical protein